MSRALEESWTHLILVLPSQTLPKHPDISQHSALDPEGHNELARGRCLLWAGI